MLFSFDEFELNAERLELRRSGELQKADALVLRLLVVLLRRAGELVTKEELVDEVWEGRAVADNVITVSMARLRKVLGDRRGEREFVVTSYGRGYRFVRPVSAREAAPAAAKGAAGAVSGPPLVGREPVLSRLRHALREARAGRGRLCVLMGEPGIGKTRAVEAFEREAEGVRVAWGYCREAGDTPPLWPWLRLLREARAFAPELEARLAPLAAEIEAVSSGSGAAERLRSRRGEGAFAFDAARHRGLDALQRAFRALAEREACVLVLDDLHRADAASIELLSLLLDEVGRSKLLVIATMRHALGRRAPRPETQLPQVLGHRNCERIALQRLSPEEVALYVGALFDDRDGKLSRAVFEKSEGNPFFMAELARQLDEGGGRAALAIPATALELIRQRVAQLHEDTRALLSAAAVIGRSFDLPLLAAAVGREPSELMASLDEAIAAEVLTAAPDSRTAFAFAHELFRTVLRDALTARELRAWHLTIGAALERRDAEGDKVPSSELAYHFHAALPEGDLRKTVDHCRAAAAASAAAFANADVVRYARHALEALDLLEEPSPRLRMRLLFTIALYARGHMPAEFRRAIALVVQLARELGDGGQLARAANMLIVNPGFAPLPEAAGALEHALELLDATNDEARATALAALACTAPRCFDAAQAVPLVEEAEARARRATEPHPLAVALRAKLYLQGGPARGAEADATADELERLAQQNTARLPVLPAQLSVHRAIIALQRGEPQALAAAISYAVARCEGVGERELRWHARRFRALAHINAGAFAAGVAELDALHRQAAERIVLGTAPFCAFDRLVVFGELTEHAVLDDALRRALDYDPVEPPSIWSLKLRALAAAGLHDEARAALRALSPEALGRLPCDSSWLGTLGHLARVALALSATEHAEAIHGLLLPYANYYAGHISFLAEGAVPQLLGMLALALGRPDDAATHLELGLEMNERAGFLPRAAEARLQLARALIDRPARATRQRARTLAREAETEANRLGMRRLALEAADVLAQEERR